MFSGTLQSFLIPITEPVLSISPIRSSLSILSKGYSPRKLQFARPDAEVFLGSATWTAV